MNLLNVVPINPETSTLGERLDELNREFAVIRWNSQTVIMTEIFTENERRSISFMTKDSFLLWNENQIVKEQDSKGNIKTHKLGKLWLEWHNRRQYRELIFLPLARERAGVYNLWSGFSFKPTPNAGKFDKFLDHIRVNICADNNDLYQWVLGWIADLFQRPDRKLGTAIVLRGKMGVGKGVFANHIGKMINRHYFAVTRAEHVTGRFNGHLADTLLLFLDEAFWAGDKDAEGTLKALVTESEVPIEMKGKDLIRIKSYLRLIIATNNAWAVPTGNADERRFAVFDVAENSRGNKQYFREIDEQLGSGGYEAMTDYFMTYKYDPVEIAKIPQTQGLLDQKMMGLSIELRWWINCLRDGKIGHNFWADYIARGVFHSAYVTFCKEINFRNISDSVRLSKLLNEKSPFKIKVRQSVDGWEYLLLPLPEARENFEKMIGHKIDWNE